MGLIAPNQWTAFQSVTHRVIHRLCHVIGPVSIKDDLNAQSPFVALPACRTGGTLTPASPPRCWTATLSNVARSLRQCLLRAQCSRFGLASVGHSQATIDARRSAEVRDGALAAMAWLERPGQHLLMWDGPGYPALLAEIDDAPPLLFVAGEPALLDRPQLAIVGSRRATPRRSTPPGHFPATSRRLVSPLPAGWR